MFVLSLLQLSPGVAPRHIMRNVGKFWGDKTNTLNIYRNNADKLARRKFAVKKQGTPVSSA
jgi:hypothetical protein